MNPIAAPDACRTFWDVVPPILRRQSFCWPKPAGTGPARPTTAGSAHHFCPRCCHRLVTYHERAGQCPSPPAIATAASPSHDGGRADADGPTGEEHRDPSPFVRLLHGLFQSPVLAEHGLVYDIIAGPRIAAGTLTGRERDGVAEAAGRALTTGRPRAGWPRPPFVVLADADLKASLPLSCGRGS